ncbi:hypothetical protein BKH42_06650 [Helicobacter sp. 13S00482-2]|uniref:hypothetical protein n=1 Tax=Helicobacter sp. 13S00482-2 TaxID=1476200 RepID=UPI000BA627BA|nr:hypothetical protein [Helicobacter sp. 13S00482-2]PAF53292.1 hypothetical protein BKH42_06650 [Helicobacter sp. 13S00482-2]
MKNYIKILICFFLPLCIHALERRPASNPNLALGFHPYGSVNFGMEYYTYTEPSVMSISGAMYHLNGLFGVKLNPFFKTDVQIYYSQDIGKNVYDGSIHNSVTNETTPLSVRSADYYLGGVGRLGLVLGDGFEEEWVTLYTGIGYRYLDNDIQNPPGQLVAYRREQSYLYMPFGLEAKFWLNNFIKFKLNGELRALLMGSNITHFTDLGWDNDAYFTQKNGSGSRVSLGVDFFITKKQSINVEAFFDYWNIKKSNLQEASRGGKFLGYYVEPDNNTKVFGVQIGYGF